MVILKDAVGLVGMVILCSSIHTQPPQLHATGHLPTMACVYVSTPLYRATIVKAWPHSTALFTEGFGFVPRDLLHQNDRPVIYESTGLYLNQSASL